MSDAFCDDKFKHSFVQKYINKQRWLVIKIDFYYFFKGLSFILMQMYKKSTLYFFIFIFDHI